MKNQSWVKTGLIVALGLALSACAQQGHQAVMESEKGMMMEGEKMKTQAGMMGEEKMMEGEKGMMKANQEMKNEDTMMKDNAGMMDKMGKDGNMKKEQMKDQNKDAM